MSFSRNRRRCPSWVGVLGSKWLGIVGFCVVSILEHCVINTAFVYHSFSYLIAISCKFCYLTLWSLPFMLPILLSSPLQGWGGEGGSEQGPRSLESLSGNTKYHSLIIKGRSSFLPRGVFSIPQLWQMPDGCASQHHSWEQSHLASLPGCSCKDPFAPKPHIWECNITVTANRQTAQHHKSCCMVVLSREGKSCSGC